MIQVLKLRELGVNPLKTLVRVFLFFVVFVAAIAGICFLRKEKRCEAQWTFVNSFLPIETNALGQVIHPTGDEIDSARRERCCIRRYVPDKLADMQYELYDPCRHRFLFARYMAEHVEFSAAQISNVFASVRYEMTKALVPVVTVSAFSENPKLALSALSFWAEAYCDNVRRSESRNQERALLAMDRKIARMRKNGEPVEALLEERENARKIVVSNIMKTFTLVPPHLVSPDRRSQ